MTRLDYGNAVLYGLPTVQLHRVVCSDSAARLNFGFCRTDHVADAFICLHWLRVLERIQFKLAGLTYRALHHSAPPYFCTFTPLSTLPGKRGLRSADSLQLVVPDTRLSTIGDRAFPVSASRTVCRLTSPNLVPLTFSVPVSKVIYLVYKFLV